MKELSEWLAANTPLEPEVNKFVELFAQERMRLLGDKTITHYVARLQRDPKEAMNLHQHLAPPETWLFRYVAAFEVLREELQKCDRSKVIHVASLGCATGSEPFSIAATALSCGFTAEQIRILALDYSDEHLALSRTGRASALAQRTPIPNWASPFLRPTTQGQLQLDPNGLAMIDFLRGDLSTWKPDRLFDFVFCRNVAIYLNEPTKKRLGKLLSEMTKPNGLVFLGHADSVILADTDMRRSEVDHAFVFAKQEKVQQRTPDIFLKAFSPAVRPVVQSLPARPAPSKPVSGAKQLPNLVETPMASTVDLFTKAQIAADSGNMLVAERALVELLAVKPAEIEAHVLFGCVQMAQNKFTEAERSFTKVVYLDPLNSLALLSLAALADLRNDAKSAERFRDRAARTVVEKRID
ncbi:MAG: CheR family methyltransferase [Phycisphaerae bacterium]